MTKIPNLLKFPVSFGYFFFALSCVIFFTITEIMGFGVRFDDIWAQKNVSYVMVALYTILPFFMAWSILRMFTKTGSNQKQSNYDVLAREDGNTSMGSLLFYGLERELVVRLSDYEKMMKRSELYGRIFAIFSMIIPGIAYIYLFFVVDPEQISNLGFLAFSSMAAGGTIGVTMGITLLKHSKSLQPYIDKLTEEIIHIRKLRIVCISSDEVLEKAHIMLKVAELLLTKQNKMENTEQKPEDSGDDLSKIGSTLLSGVTAMKK